MQMDSIVISDERLKSACLEDRYARKLEQPEVFPTDEQWKYIIRFKMATLAKKLYHKFLVAVLTPKAEQTQYHKAAIENIADYLSAIPRDVAIETVYSDVKSAPRSTLALIEKCKLFDAKQLARLIDEGRASFAVDAINYYQPEYTDEDLILMSDLDEMLNNLPPVGEVRQVRGLFRDEMKYVCPNGHANHPDNEFCSEPGCGLDIYGLTEKQYDYIDQYSHRVGVLQRLIGEERRNHHESL